MGSLQQVHKPSIFFKFAVSLLEFVQHFLLMQNNNIFSIVNLKNLEGCCFFPPVAELMSC